MGPPIVATQVKKNNRTKNEEILDLVLAGERPSRICQRYPQLMSNIYKLARFRPQRTCRTDLVYYYGPLCILWTTSYIIMDHFVYYYGPLCILLWTTLYIMDHFVYYYGPLCILLWTTLYIMDHFVYYYGPLCILWTTSYIIIEQTLYIITDHFYFHSLPHVAEATFGSYAESPPPEDRTIRDKIFAR